MGKRRRSAQTRKDQSGGCWIILGRVTRRLVDPSKPCVCDECLGGKWPEHYVGSGKISFECYLAGIPITDAERAREEMREKLHEAMRGIERERRRRVRQNPDREVDANRWAMNRMMEERRWYIRSGGDPEEPLSSAKVAIAAGLSVLEPGRTVADTTQASRDGQGRVVRRNRPGTMRPGCEGPCEGGLRLKGRRYCLACEHVMRRSLAEQTQWTPEEIDRWCEGDDAPLVTGDMTAVQLAEPSAEPGAESAFG